MKEILIGTHNRHKKEEISKLLQDLPLKIRDLTEFPDVKTVDEDGTTLEENALKKAKVYSSLTGLDTIADDTGLEVDALGGAPGVYSARYAGENCTYLDNCNKLVRELSKINNAQRKALFRTVIAYVQVGKEKAQMVEGSIQGEILKAVQGTHGFGYDPIFYVPHLKKTLAELTLEEKNQVSHRARAILKAKEILKANA